MHRRPTVQIQFNPELSMKASSRFALSSCFVLFTASVFAADAADELSPAPSEKALPSAALPDRYIVQLAAGVDGRGVAASHGVSPRFFYQNAVHGFAGAVAPGRLAALRADPRVLRVVPDRAVAAIGKPAGPGGGGGGSFQIVPAGVQRIGAAPINLVYTGAGIGVAVVDTGVDFDHNDLKPLGASSFSAFGSSAQDNNGHGTHVAGIIAARNNSTDVVGVAREATIYAVKVLDASGNGSDAAVIAGLDWVAQNTSLVNPIIRVVNMSLGREGTLDDNPVLRASVQALHASGIAVIVAAGNDAVLEASQQVPSTYPEVIAVASTTARAGTNQYRFFNGVISADTASYFTSDGAYNAVTGIGVTISCPGEDQEDITKAGFIKSTGILSTKLGGGTTRMSGTSMAAPHVAGVAALVYQKNSGLALDGEDVRDRLIVGALNQNAAPLDSPTNSYTFDGVREGVLSAPGALGP